MSRITGETAVTTLVDADVLLVDNPTLGTRKIAHSALKAQYEQIANKGVASGYASLGADGLVPATQLQPSFTAEEVADAAARNALTVIAGEVGKRLVRLVDTGVYYIAIATGSGASKWQVFNSIAAASTSAAGAVELSTEAEAVAEASATLALTPSTAARQIAANRNALAPQGGIYCDGTASTFARATLTNQNIGTDPCAVAIKFQMPTANPGAKIGLWNLSSDGTLAVAYSAHLCITTAGKLELVLFGASSSDYRLALVDAAISSFGGKTVLVKAVRTSSTLKIYIDGKDTAFTETTAGTPPDWTGTITSTYLHIGSLGTSGYSFVGPIRSFSLYNCELSQTDVTEIYQIGGAVPFRFQFGSQGALYSSDFSAGLESWAQNIGNPDLVLTANVDGISGVDDTMQAQATNGGKGFQIAKLTGLVLAAMKAHRVTFDYFAETGAFPATASWGTRNDGARWDTGANVVTLNAWTAQTVNFISGASADIGLSVFGTTSSASITNLADTKSVYLKNIVAKRVGAVAHYALDDGIGYQLHDASSNALHAAGTATGVSHLIANFGPQRIRGTTNTNGNQAVQSGVTLLVANSQITRIRARSRAGTPTITLGTASGGNQLVASVALSTTWKDLTVALTGGIVSTADDVWVGSDSTDVVEIDITWEPLGF